MSKQLAISASFSVLVMSAYVLFGGDAVRTLAVQEGYAAAASATAPGLSANPGRLQPILR